MTCAEVKERFGVTTECCKHCHEVMPEPVCSILQGGESVPICCLVSLEGNIADNAAFCDEHGEWYPPGLRCLSCEKDAK